MIPLNTTTQDNPQTPPIEEEKKKKKKNRIVGKHLLIQPVSNIQRLLSLLFMH